MAAVLLRKSVSRRLYQVPGGYEVIHRGTSAVSVRTLVTDPSQVTPRVWQHPDVVWLPIAGLRRVIDLLGE